ncbi:hypothetical protein Mag101_01170 [Microbulbifer agarilyticus]|uniref:Uncharacterized protein n=1 Tax=Microbulbifer agarilyticus TaxID=260552 RepID=A0A1Q2M170_9GAMM|nr:hypothetical protein Mag101_01170 [Microbulbifer agarilyticus]
MLAGLLTEATLIQVIHIRSRALIDNNGSDKTNTYLPRHDYQIANMAAAEVPVGDVQLEEFAPERPRQQRGWRLGSGLD